MPPKRPFAFSVGENMKKICYSEWFIFFIFFVHLTIDPDCFIHLTAFVSETAATRGPQLMMLDFMLFCIHVKTVPTCSGTCQTLPPLSPCRSQRLSPQCRSMVPEGTAVLTGMNNVLQSCMVAVLISQHHALSGASTSQGHQHLHCHRRFTLIPSWRTPLGHVRSQLPLATTQLSCIMRWYCRVCSFRPQSSTACHETSDERLVIRAWTTSMWATVFAMHKI